MKKIQIDYQSEKSCRAKFVLWLLEKGVPIHAKLNKHRKAWNLNSDDLLLYPKKSLGNVLGKFYKEQKFEPIAKAERHDVFRVLLNYSTHVIDEAAMQFFLWGNGKPSFFTVGSCIITMILFPGKTAYFMNAFNRGKNARPIGNWNFKLLLDMPLTKLQQKIFN